MASNDLHHDCAATGGQETCSVARVVSEICQALVSCAPEYSDVHDDLAPLLAKSEIGDVELLNFMVNNRRCHVTAEGELESLNLGGYSLERVGKKLGAALEDAVFEYGLAELHLSGNSIKDVGEGLGWLIVEVKKDSNGEGNGRDQGEADGRDQEERYKDPALSSIFLEANIIRELSWPPTSLISLRRSLKCLNLSKNRIRLIDVVAAPLPQPITLHSLERLDISGNISLSAIPDGFFPSVPNLQCFEAYSCALTSLPEDISVCRKLTHCGLHSNELACLPDGLFECDKLTWLSLNMNKIEDLPERIGNLRNLRRLSLHINELKTLPTSISRCTHLEALSVHRNKLISLPDSMALLKECSRLSLYENKGLVRVPDGVCGMTGLKELWLSDCGLATLNDKIGNLCHLQKLHLDMNPGLVLDDSAWEALKRLDLYELYLGDLVAVTEKEQREAELRAAMAQLTKIYL